MPKVLQFGATGQVGQALVAAAGRAVTLTVLSRAEVDLTDAAAIRAAIRAANCDLVWNAAAFTLVDRAEAEPDAAFAVNAAAPAAMAAACAERDLPFVHLSTDSVFNGQTGRPYVETDTAEPISVYGRSKLAGEQGALAHPRTTVLRVSWVFSPYGRNYVSFMLNLGRTREVLQVVADQFGSYDFARAAIARDPLTRARLEPTTQGAFVEAAARPPRSPLDSSKLAATFGFTPQPWKPAVERVADQLVRNGI
ncbi:MAG: NAD(P)-dependent oxidoreductase [Caulobacter sp. 12-67-6]|nr:MAG: NAD(P)-dependent oxidoreductase [Caulobacter sp. 12-67-6]